MVFLKKEGERICMKIPELVKHSRSIRRFRGEIPVSRETLTELIDCARMTPSSVNRQPLRYVMSSEEETNRVLRSCTRWAGLLRDWDGPQGTENPAAYIVICCDRNIGPASSYAYDAGIAAQTILLAAAERGLGGCIIGSVERETVKEALTWDEDLEIMLVIALGVPGEEIVLEELPDGASTAYYRDENGVHHVPKRSLESVMTDAEIRKR